MRLLYFAIFLLSCGVQKNLSSLCQHKGTIRHSEYIDGCQWLIQTDDGKIYLPENFTDFPMADRQAISFSFVPFDGMSICMAEDAIITLTCMQWLGKSTCEEPPNDWEQIDWMRKIVSTVQPRQIDRYIYEQRYVYRIQVPGGQDTWYTCDGALICNDTEGCSIIDLNANDRVAIYVAHR